MFNTHRLIVICNIESQIDATTGNRSKVVANARKIIGNKQLVGIQTQQLAQLQNANFAYSIEIDRMFFNEQKYLYIDGVVYEIKSISPAKHQKDCKLNVSVIDDNDIKVAIVRWLNGSV